MTRKKKYASDLSFTLHRALFSIGKGRQIYISLMVRKRFRLIGTGKREMRFKRRKRCPFPACTRLVSSS